MNYCAARDIESHFTINDEQRSCLKEIGVVTRRIYELLKDDQCQFELSASGGCVRDSLLMDDPKIKDIDLLFFPTKFAVVNPKEFKLRSSIRRRDYDDEFDEISKEYSKKIESMVGKLKLNFNMVKFMPSLDEDSPYFSPYIAGVIKIEDPFLSYPVEIILSKSLKVKTFIDYCYDFDLCKVGIDSSLNDNEGFGIFFTDSFLSDYKNKKITFSNTYFDYNELVYSMEKHYVRIKEKYPSYKLDYDKSNKNITVSMKTLLDYSMLMDGVNPSEKEKKSSFRI